MQSSGILKESRVARRILHPIIQCIMETNHNKLYEAPSTTVMNVRFEGIICVSDVPAKTQGGTEDYILNNPLEW